MALRIGLTGGIGSGKSTVATLLDELGATIVDTDAIARQLAAPGGAAIEAIRAAFGADMIDAAGALDRARMRSLAFTDAEAKRRLEAILHPLIAREAELQASAAQGPGTVFDIPLLIESRRWPARLDRVWVVDCREATQIERVSQRAGWNRAAAVAVIAQQATRSARRAHADAVLYNDGIALAALAQEVSELWRESLAPVR